MRKHEFRLNFHLEFFFVFVLFFLSSSVFTVHFFSLFYLFIFILFFFHFWNNVWQNTFCTHVDQLRTCHIESGIKKNVYVLAYVNAFVLLLLFKFKENFCCLSKCLCVCVRCAICGCQIFNIRFFGIICK